MREVSTIFAILSCIMVIRVAPEATKSLFGDPKTSYALLTDDDQRFAVIAAVATGHVYVYVYVYIYVYVYVYVYDYVYVYVYVYV